jgi:phenylpyruvate tautomerase PptA (4-oxalocrotonate tautomerase family)
MPLVRISVIEGTSASRIAAIGEGIHRAMIETINIPPDDRFQVITEHGPDRLVFDRGHQGIASSAAGFVLVQIKLRSGRTNEQKQALYARIAAHLEEAAGVRPEDVMVTLIENELIDWSFGNGIAQYVS